MNFFLAIGCLLIAEVLSDYNDTLPNESHSRTKRQVNFPTSSNYNHGLRPSLNLALEGPVNQITWLKGFINRDLTVTLPGLTRSSTGPKAYKLAGKEAKDEPFQSCSTPKSEPGHCRYLRHCVLPEFTNNFQAFKGYVCFINSQFVGACCPDSRYPQRTPVPTRPAELITPPLKGLGCGSRSGIRIVNGRDAGQNNYPWAAILLKGTAEAPITHCGGAIISNKHVLTAAHCLDGIRADTIIVRLGEYSFSENTESPHKDFKIAKAKLHEDYDRITYINDIALITLDRVTEFSNEIRPICLPPPEESFVNKNATVIGWGTIYWGGPNSAVLQEVSVPVWPNEECVAAYKKIDLKIFPVNLCAGDKAGGKDSCRGDSGGPLMLQHGSERRWTVIGVVSWGKKCAEADTPGVYARVNKYLSWIEANTI